MCAMYAGRRDVSMFRGVNRELIKKVIQSEVDILKVSVEESKTNLYGESLKKTYYQDIRLACMIKLEPQDVKYDGHGGDVSQLCRFAFLRDDLMKANIFVQIGDIIDWNGNIWEIDKVQNSNLLMNRNPDYNKTIDTYEYNDLDNHKFGWNISVICETHATRLTRAGLQNTYSGEPKD